MFDKTTSFFVFEFIDECPEVDQIVELLKGPAYRDIQKTSDFSCYNFMGPDHIHNEHNFIAHPAMGLVGFSVLYQERKINQDLFKKELERVLREEYGGIKLPKHDLALVKETVLGNIVHRFPVIYKTSDVIIDQHKSRIYIRSSGDKTLFKTISLISSALSLENVSLRPWFPGEFVDKTGTWENTQTLFLYWLNETCRQENKYNIYAGTKIDMKDSRRRVKITGNHSGLSGLWDLFESGRRIDSVNVVLKEKDPYQKPEDAAKDGQHYVEVLAYRLNVRKLGFYEFKDHRLYSRKVRCPADLFEKTRSLELFLDHFDSICLAFLNDMKNVDINDLLCKILRLDKE